MVDVGESRASWQQALRNSVRDGELGILLQEVIVLY
jgi:hypothetical protein